MSLHTIRAARCDSRHMPYPNPFLRIVMSGTTYAAEGFSIGLNIGQNFDGPLSQPSDLTPYVTACKDWFARVDTRISGLAKLNMVKVNLVGTNGKYVSQTSSGTVEVTPVVTGGGGAIAVPPQNTLAVTLTTANLRGTAVRGRIYPPLLSLSPAADGFIVAASALGVANSMATFVNALNAIGPGDVSIMSDVGAGKVGRVTGVRVGRVVDTQRRRRRSLPETPVLATTAITVPAP